jgi:hypothetical protein
MKEHHVKDRSPEKSLQRIVDYMPSFYAGSRYFSECTEALERGDLKLAARSLIRLAAESGHYFSEEYWETLADVADSLNINEERSFCKEQIRRNESELHSKTPFGWTTVKIDETHLRHYIPEKLQEEWASARRERDHVQELLPHDGIYIKPYGRSGFIYFVNKGRLAEFETEIGVNGHIIYFSSSNSWVLPSRQPITQDEKQFIKDKISEWAWKTGTAIEID